jgi:DNA polymerase-3 subunit delta
MPETNYLLLGPEIGEKAAFIAKLKKGIEAKVGQPPEEHKFYPFDSSMSEVVSLLKNGSLFSQHRFVVINDVHELKKAEAEILADYLSQPAPEVTLLLLSEQFQGQIDRKLSSRIPKENVKIFWELFEGKKHEWIVSFFKGRSITMSQEARDLLLDMVENNTQELKQVCGQLALYYGEGSEIRPEDIEQYLFHSKEETVFSLFDRIASGDFPGSVEVLRKILQSGDAESVQIFAGLLWQFRKLLEFSRLLDQGLPAAAAFTELKISSKKGQKTYTDARKLYATVQIERIIVLISRFDAMVRGTRSDMQALLLELFLYRCIVKKGEPAQDPAEVYL